MQAVVTSEGMEDEGGGTEEGQNEGSGKRDGILRGVAACRRLSHRPPAPLSAVCSFPLPRLSSPPSQLAKVTSKGGAEPAPLRRGSAAYSCRLH